MFGSNIRELLTLSQEGGGAGAAGGNASETRQPLTEEDVGRIVNSAITSHMKRNDPKAAIKEALEGLNLREVITSTVKELVPQPPQQGGEGGDKGKPKIPEEFAKQFADMNAKLEAAEKARLDAEQQRAEIETRARTDQARSAFRQLLQPKVRPELLDVAVEHFASKAMKLGEDGSPLLRIKRAPYKGAPVEDQELPLEEAMPHFLASEQIKPFLPAPGGHQENGGHNGQRRPVVTGGAGAGGDDIAALQADLEKRGLSLDSLF